MRDELINAMEVKFNALERKFELLENTFAMLRDQNARESYQWRSLVVLLLVLFIGITALGFVADQRQHGADNKERATHWTLIEQGNERNRGMIVKNWEALKEVDNHLRQCSECHSHPAPIKIEK
jgi:uncharacterized protein HemX